MNKGLMQLMSQPKAKSVTLLSAAFSLLADANHH